MSAAIALLNHLQSAQTMAGRAAPMASSSSDGASSASTTSANISANDFLTLLVTEMKNQDPTANTDPNEYINQLVQVNSLEQLIGIHETLSAALGPSGDASTPSPQAAHRLLLPAAINTSAPAQRQGEPLAFGNLSAGEAQPAALRVAHALDGSPVAPGGAAASGAVHAPGLR